MDRLAAEPSRFAAFKQAQAGSATCLYRFNYDHSSRRSEWKAAPHGSDVPFFFDALPTRYGPAASDQDRGMSRLMQSYLTNFAINGDPNGAGLSRWERVKPNDGKIMQFLPDGRAQFGPDPRTPKLDAIAASADKQWRASQAR